MGDEVTEVYLMYNLLI